MEEKEYDMMGFAKDDPRRPENSNAETKELNDFSKDLGICMRMRNHMHHWRCVTIANSSEKIVHLPARHAANQCT